MAIRNDASLQVVGHLFIGLAVIAVIGGLSLLMAWPFMWLWNYAVVSAVTIAKPIGYWVAFWLACFSGIYVRASSSSSSSKS